MMLSNACAFDIIFKCYRPAMYSALASTHLLWQTAYHSLHIIFLINTNGRQHASPDHNNIGKNFSKATEEKLVTDFEYYYYIAVTAIL